MAKFEALMENKMNPDTQTEQSKPQSRELSDQELAQASGGEGDAGKAGETYVWKRDSQGRATHWIQDGEIWHYICPRCGRILHRGTFYLWYCDPCDDWFTDGQIRVIDQEA